MMRRLVFIFHLLVLNLGILKAQSNVKFIQCPIGNKVETDSDEFNKVVKSFEDRFNNVLIIRLDEPQNVDKQKYIDFAEKHKNWGLIYFNWNARKAKSDYVSLSNSELSISSVNLTFSLKKEIDENEVNSLIAEGRIINVSKTSAPKRFYYELSKNPEKYVCLTGELFDFLFDDCEKIVKEIENPFKEISDKIKKQSNEIDAIDHKIEILENQNKRLISKADSILKGNDDIKKDLSKKGNLGFSNVSVSSQVYKNLSSISLDARWMKAAKWYSQYGFGIGFRSGQYAYDLYENQRSYTNQNSLISLGDISEKGNIRFLSAKASLLYSNVVYSKLGSSHDFFWFSLKLNFCGNFIQSNHYSWTSGSMNVRGKLDGIGDEIINVPDLGYRDGINLVGVNGTADLKRFFPSVEGEVTLHYNLEKMDFFGGMGYTASPILKASRPDLLISDGTHFNSLTATTKPISIRTPFISIGMSIIF